jgi:hypothetical protein
MAQLAVNTLLTVVGALFLGIVFYYARLVWEIRAPMRRVIKMGKASRGS